MRGTGKTRLAAMVAAICVALLASGMTFNGCGFGGPGTGDHLRAREIDDGATPYNPEQWSCPVTPWMSQISPDVYVDYEGKRIYFASQKAKEKFQNADEEQKQGFLAIVEQQGHTPGKGGGQSGKKTGKTTK